MTSPIDVAISAPTVFAAFNRVDVVPVPAETIAAARKLARRSPKTGKRRTLRAISAELAALGHLGPSGKLFLPGSISQMLG